MSTSIHSVATKQRHTDTNFLLPGNIVPHTWFQEIVSESGRTDHNAISIFSEIVYWYKPDKAGATKFPGTIWQTSYEHFQNKFGYNKQKIRRALVRLEELGRIKREFHTVYKYGQRYNNVLFIDLLISKAESHPKTEVSIENNLYSKPLSREPEAILHKALPTTSIDLDNKESSMSLPTSLPIYNFDTPSLQECRDHIDNKTKTKIKKDRSRGSNFMQNSLGNLKIEEVTKLKSLTAISHFNKTKHLQDFYPLSEKECLELKHLSGRDFSLNAMNEILQDVARKKPEWSCGSKKGFMTYMTKVLKFEKRQAVLVSGEGFRIRNNLTAEEINSKAQEKFLADIENSSQTSPELHFKKKLAAVLDPNTAYKLLKAYSSSSREGDILKLNLITSVELTAIEKEIILQQAKATHEKLYGEEIVLISKLDFTIKENTRAAMQVTKDDAIQIPSGVWGNMRLKLMKHFGSEGKALDESWFSKLSAEVDEQERVVRLKAPTTFMKDWINNKYGSLLDGFCQTEHFRFTEIEA